MKQKRTLLLIAISLFAFTLLMCEYTDYPDPIWDEDDAGNAAPVITSMSPPDLAYEGITEITITGSNFSSVPSQNQVTFNGYAARLDEANSTSTQLVLTTPVFITESRGSEFNAVDSVQILVAAQGAYSPAEYDQPFRVERAVVKLGGFAGEAPAKNATTVTADANGNIYVAAEDKILYKIDSVGVRTAYATGLSGAERDLKAADPGTVYFARNIPYIYRVDPGGGASVRWLKAGSKVACLDFDQNQDIYAGGNNDSLYWVDVDAEFARGVAPAEDYVYNSLRVYNGYVYVSGEYEGTDTNVTVTQGIWKHEIVAGQDTLGARTLVYDWANYTYADEQDITSFVIDENGLLYIGTSTGSGPAIVNLDEGTQTTMPFYDTVLDAPAEHLFMGNDTYIYAVIVDPDNSDAVTTIPVRIAQSNTGSTYYGH